MHRWIFNVLLVIVFSNISQSVPAEDNKVDKNEQTKVVAATAQVIRSTAGLQLAPSNVDPQDKTERVLLMVPGGLFVVDIDITIDGLPFRIHREAAVTRVLERADKDSDGKLTFDELFEYPTFSTGRFAAVANNKQYRERLVRQYDTDKDGTANKAEVRTMLALAFGAPTFSLSNYRSAYGAGSPIVKLLDTNNDKTLSSNELAAAETQLKSRDADDDDVLTLAELTGTLGGSYRQLAVNRGMTASAILFHLHDKTNWNTIYTAMVQRYGSNGKLTGKEFPLTPNLFKSFDTDGNRVVQNREFTHFLKLPPHIHLEANFGKKTDLPRGISVKSITEELKAKLEVGSKDGKQINIKLPECELKLLAGGTLAQQVDYETYAKAIIDRYDKNRNGYLEKKESEAQVGLSRQFRVLDTNRDGKVYADEIEAMYTRSQNYNANRITVGAVDRGGWLVSKVDLNNDAKIGLREMRAASAHLMRADTNDDGEITEDEVPRTVRFAIAVGATANQLLSEAQATASRTGYPRSQAVSPQSSQLDWFVHMDRNGDGDISHREFLGDESQFKMLDANDDGLIDAKEAATAKETE